VYDLAETESEVGTDVDCGHNLQHGKLSDSGQSVRCQRQSGRPGPGAFQNDVLQIIFDEFADAWAAIATCGMIFSRKFGSSSEALTRAKSAWAMLVSHRGCRNGRNTREPRLCERRRRSTCRAHRAAGAAR
jgi:hypothetical protein